MVSEEHKGIKVYKSDASTMIGVLRQQGLIHPNLLIRQEEDFVIIPILDEPEPNFNQTVISHELVSTWFDIDNRPPNSLKEALKELEPNLPEEMIPTSFDQIGDIAIIDLKEPMLPYKLSVGRAIMIANPSIVGVYRKSSKVRGEYRLRGLEYLAGEKNTRTIHREYGLEIHVDVEKAYFSPRLATEHNRIAQKVKTGDRVLDLFGGLAPFGLHITKNVVATVISVDINPEIPDLIRTTIKSNPSLVGTIEIRLGDAKQIAVDLFTQNEEFDHIIMNHPSRAVDYLSSAEKLLRPMGRIFLYVFAPMDDLEKYCRQIVSDNSNLRIADIHIVRQSSPSEYHVCIELIK